MTQADNVNSVYHGVKKAYFTMIEKDRNIPNINLISYRVVWNNGERVLCE